MLQIFIGIVLGAHLLFVSLAAAGPLVAIGLQWRAPRDPLAAGVGRRLAWLSVAALVIGAVLGLAVGAGLWNDAYAVVLRRLSSRIFFGVIELCFSLVLLLAYAVWWRRPPERAVLRIVHGALAMLAGTNLLYHFPLLFVVLSDLVSTQSVHGESMGAGDFRELVSRPYVIARAVHFVLAAGVVAGAAVIGIAWHSGGQTESPDRRAAMWGARIAIVPGLLQIPVGFWMISQMPAAVQRRIMGSDGLAGVLLLLSVAIALWLLHQLSALAIGELTPRLMARTVLLTVILVVMMTVAGRRAHDDASPSAGHMSGKGAGKYVSRGTQSQATGKVTQTHRHRRF